MVIDIEKQKVDVMVSIYNSRKLIRVLKMLEEYKVNVKGINDNVKFFHGILLVDSMGLEYIKNRRINVNGLILNVDEIGIERCIVNTIIYSRISHISKQRNMIVGIDFGDSIGIAIFVNSDIVLVNSYKSKEKVLEILKMFIEYSDNIDIKTIRIGLPRFLSDKYNTFVDILIKSFRNHPVNFEFVPEDKSSKQRQFIDNMKLDKDSIAAINIALMRVGSS